MKVRVARAHEANAIVDLIQRSIPERHVRLSVMGCTGAAQYVRDRIGLWPRDSSVFIVAVDDGVVFGAAELRRRTDSMFVNHIVVSGETRGQGIARRLLRFGVQSLRVHPDNTVELDVFSDNTPVAAWYGRLGLEVVSVADLTVVSTDDAAPGMWSVDELLQCRLLLGTYGFGSCRVVTDMAEYGIGVLDSGVIRTRAISGDEPALSAVAELWPGSTLISAEKDLGDSEPPYATSLRMTGGVGRMMEAIGDR